VGATGILRLRGLRVHPELRLSNNGNIAAGAGDAGNENSLDRCLIATNVIGVDAETTALARVSNSEVTNNVQFGFANFGSNFQTLGNNTVYGNGADTTGIVTTVAPQSSRAIGWSTVPARRECSPLRDSTRRIEPWIAASHSWSSPARSSRSSA